MNRHNHYDDRHGRLNVPMAVPLIGQTNQGGVKMQLTRHAVPLAQPVQLVLQGPGVAQVHVFGGLSPLQHAAIEIAAGMAAFHTESLDQAQFPILASRAVALANDVLAECGRVEAEISAMAAQPEERH